MAQTFYAVENLGAPFRRVCELSMVVAPSYHRVTNNARKIVLVLGGYCRHRFDNGSLTTLQKGDALIVSSPIAQHYKLPRNETTAKLHALVISFDNAASAHLESTQFIEKYFQENIVAHHVMDAALFGIVAQIREEAELRLPGFSWRMTSLCAAGIVHLARCINAISVRNNEDAPAAQSGIFLVSSAKEYLIRHLDQPLTMDDVADALHVSSGHLAHTFTRVAGQSLFTYFRHLRLEQAKLELVNSDNNVTEIAMACGFSSTTLFCRNFKKYVGVTPLTYRNKFGAGWDI